MESKLSLDQSLRSKLDERLSRLEQLGKHLASLAELRQLVDQLQAERDHLQQRVDQLQAERDRMQAERNQLLHAWADLHFPEDELDRRSRETGGGPLSELLQRLEGA